MKRITLIISALIAAALIAACGSSSKKDTTSTPQASAAASSSSPAQAVSDSSTKAAAKLPQPQAGVINIADGESLGITKKVDDKFGAAGGTGITVNDNAVSSNQAFNQLCTGKADIALVTQQPSVAQLAECDANGITFKESANGQPLAITLAADAIVVATKNESNVGGDCLRRQTVRDIFQPGSTLDNWAQIGFDDIPLSTTVRSPAYVNTGDGLAETGTFPLFANLVLGVQGNASEADVRSDNKYYGTDDKVRFDVIAHGQISKLVKAEAAEITRRERAANDTIKAQVAAARAAANKKILAKIAAANKALAAKKVVLTAAQAAQLVATNAAQDEAAQDQAGSAALQAADARIQKAVRALYRSRLNRAANPGVLGVFRFTYYELWENQLRPMEIWDPVASTQELQDEGIATNASRVGDQITVTARQQAGGGTGEVETVVQPSTPTTAGSSYTSDGKQTLKVPAGGPVDVDTTPNCIFPSQQTITSGVYPLSIQLYAYVPKRELKRSEIKQYLEYFIGAGQTEVNAERLVPIDDTTREDEYRFVSGGHNLPQSLLSAGSTPSGAAAGTTSGFSSATSNSAVSSGSSSSSTSGTGAANNTQGIG